MTRDIAIIGAGRLGTALADGWAAVPDLRVYRVTRREGLAPDARLDVAVLAVKPKDVEGALAMHGATLGDAPLVSCAAGIPLAALRAWAGPRRRLARAMPNICAAVGASTTTIVTDADDAAWMGELTTLFGHLGTVQVMPPKDEECLDAVTALSGSGPAYVYEMVAALAAAGEALGLDSATSRRLAAETARGAALMLLAHPDRSVRRLVDQVASPGGTTEAALHQLQAGGWHRLLGEAVRAAHRRAHGLASADEGPERVARPT